MPKSPTRRRSSLKRKIVRKRRNSNLARAKQNLNLVIKNHFGKRRSSRNKKSRFGSHGNAMTLSQMMGPFSHFGSHGDAPTLSQMMGPASHFGRRRRSSRKSKFGSHGNAPTLAQMMGPASHFGGTEDKSVSSLGRTTLELLFGRRHKGVRNSFGRKRRSSHKKRSSFGRKRRSSKRRH